MTQDSHREQSARVRYIEGPVPLEAVKTAFIESDRVAAATNTRPKRTFPLCAKICADLLTPVAVYKKISAGEQYSLILESVRGASDISRFSYIAASPRAVIETGRDDASAKDPLVGLEQDLAQHDSIVIDGMPPFTGGAVGFVGYDCVRYFEPKSWEKPPSKNPLALPESVMMYLDTIIVFDNAFQTIIIISNIHRCCSSASNSDCNCQNSLNEANCDLEAGYAKAKAEIERIALLLTSNELKDFDISLPDGTADRENEREPESVEEMESNVGEKGYCSFVRALKENIQQGDIIQAVPSQRIARRTFVAPFNIYRMLRTINPSPYMFFLDIGGEFQLIGASPELLVRAERVEPIFKQKPSSHDRFAANLRDAILIDDRSCHDTTSEIHSYENECVRSMTDAQDNAQSGAQSDTQSDSQSDTQSEVHEELLPCLRDGYEIEITTHPIAGTIRRGKSAAEDAANAEILKDSAKDRAEHVMLVDLARNDVNRVCRYETTVLDHLMRIERFSHVMHLVSQVRGCLRTDKTRFDALRSVFPAGTVSGAPKVRAMQLIYGLEDEKRGVYAGAIGIWGYMSEQMETCIALRTMVAKNGYVYLQAGGGIVLDSDEKEEYEETLNKLRANVTCIEKAEKFFSRK